MNGKITVAKLVVAFAIACSVSRPAWTDVIGVDAVHGFDSDTILATGTDSDTFRATITELGHTIVPISSFQAGDLAGLDALFASQPYGQNNADYSTGEMAAIREFVAAGAGLVVTADNGSGFHVANMNALVAPYGIQYASRPSEGNGHTITGFVSHAVTAGLNSIGVDFQLRITTRPPSLDLTTGAGADNALSVLEGGGHAVFLSATGIWSDSGSGSQRPITFGDNRLLLENIISYVTSSSGCDPCDANCDGSVDLTDVEPFILLLLGGDPCAFCTGDTNDDGSVDLTDVEGFIDCLLG